MRVFMCLLVGVALTVGDKLDRTYLPPPGSKFSGGSPGSIQVPLEYPKLPSGFDNINLGQLGPEISEIPGIVQQGPFQSSSQTPTKQSQNVPTTTTSYAFTQTTTYSPIEDNDDGNEYGSQPTTPEQSYGIQNIPGQITTQTRPGQLYNQYLPDQVNTQYTPGLDLPGQSNIQIRPGQNIASRPGQINKQLIPGQTVSQYTPGQGVIQTFPGQSNVEYRPGQNIKVYPGQQTSQFVPGQDAVQNIPGQTFTQTTPGQVKYQNYPGQGNDQFIPGQSGNVQQAAPGLLYQNQPIQGNAQFIPGQSFQQTSSGQPNVPQGQINSQYTTGQQNYPDQSPNPQNVNVNYPQQQLQQFPTRSQASTTQRPLQAIGQQLPSSTLAPQSFPSTTVTPQTLPTAQFGQKFQPTQGPTFVQNTTPAVQFGNSFQTPFAQGTPGQSQNQQNPLPTQGSLNIQPGFNRNQNRFSPQGVTSTTLAPQVQDYSKPSNLNQQQYPAQGTFASSTASPISPDIYSPSTPVYPGNQISKVGPTNASLRAQADSDRNAVILNYKNELTPEGFAYSFDTSNGIHADENGTAIDGVKAQGAYSYIGDDGKLYSVVYTADENGFRPTGDHLPTPPPIPEAIRRVIEQANKDKEAGIINDGSYDEDRYGYKKYQEPMDSYKGQGKDKHETRPTGDDVSDDSVNDYAEYENEKGINDNQENENDTRLANPSNKLVKDERRRPINRISDEDKDKDSGIKKQSGRKPFIPGEGRRPYNQETDEEYSEVQPDFSTRRPEGSTRKPTIPFRPNTNRVVSEDDEIRIQSSDIPSSSKPYTIYDDNEQDTESDKPGKPFNSLKKQSNRPIDSRKRPQVKPGGTRNRPTPAAMTYKDDNVEKDLTNEYIPENSEEYEYSEETEEKSSENASRKPQLRRPVKPSSYNNRKESNAGDNRRPIENRYRPSSSTQRPYNTPRDNEEHDEAFSDYGDDQRVSNSPYNVNKEPGQMNVRYFTQKPTQHTIEEDGYEYTAPQRPFDSRPGLGRPTGRPQNRIQNIPKSNNTRQYSQTYQPYGVQSSTASPQLSQNQNDMTLLDNQPNYNGQFTDNGAQVTEENIRPVIGYDTTTGRPIFGQKLPNIGQSYPTQAPVSSTTSLPQTPTYRPQSSQNYPTNQYQSTFRPFGSNTQGSQRFPDMRPTYVPESTQQNFRPGQQSGQYSSTTYRPNYPIFDKTTPKPVFDGTTPNYSQVGLQSSTPGYSTQAPISGYQQNYQNIPVQSGNIGQYPTSSPNAFSTERIVTSQADQPNNSVDQYGMEIRPGQNGVIDQNVRVGASPNQVIGEDFSGPKQQQKFDPKTGYYY